MWLVLIPFWTNAQVSNASFLSESQTNENLRTSGIKEIGDKGIQWVEGVSFQEATGKAKLLNKYIFLDCFATWCGPCKVMDKEVYKNDSVASYFNEHFICLKVQMDKTAKDNEFVKNWYTDAAAIARQYRVLAFPTFIFLSPEGQIVQMETGFKEPDAFLALAKMATRPGKIFEDPYAAYDRLIKEYKGGGVRYDSMVYMIKTAQKFDQGLANELIKLYSGYAANLDAKHRYTKDNISFWSLKSLKSDSKVFGFFYKDGKEIDRVMQERGFAADVVDKTIYLEIIIPFFKEQNKNQKLSMTGMYMSGGGLQSDSSEADWGKLFRIIGDKYNKQVAQRNVLAARIEWYKRHLYMPGVSKYMLIQLKQYPRDLRKCFMQINDQAWEVFLHSRDKALLKGYTKWMKKLLMEFPSESTMMDTYANLLYKMGQQEIAVAWEEKALQFANKRQFDVYNKVINQMKRREPTYGVQTFW
jgi:thioredoxin-related protein